MIDPTVHQMIFQTNLYSKWIRLINVHIEEKFWFIMKGSDPLNLLIESSYFDMNKVNGGFMMTLSCNNP